MFAVIKTGGKQYKVTKDDTLVVERLAADVGETVQFEDVLMLGGDAPQVGAPFVPDAAVRAEVLEQGRGEKIYNFKRRRRKHGSRRLKGHRQYLTTLKVTEILAPGMEAAVDAAETNAPLVADATSPDEADKAPDAAVEAEAPTDVAESKMEETRAEADGKRPGNLLEEAQGAPDDLTGISGVDSELADKLDANGVFHYRQIAEWSPAEAAFMDKLLGLEGRIVRNDWIGQARALAAAAES